MILIRRVEGIPDVRGSLHHLVNVGHKGGQRAESKELSAVHQSTMQTMMGFATDSSQIAAPYYTQSDNKQLTTRRDETWYRTRYKQSCVQAYIRSGQGNNNDF